MNYTNPLDSNVKMKQKPRRGPHTVESREKAEKSARESWKQSRQDRLVVQNQNRRQSPIRDLRVELVMSQSDFAEAIGLSRNAPSRIGTFENGLRPTAELIARMEELAADNGIEWKYE